MPPPGGAHTGKMTDKSRADTAGQRKRAWTVAAIALGTIAAQTVLMRRRGYKVGLKTVVRCRDGHLFTTIWIPGASLKAIRLGTVRLQYCPVGRHVTSVRPMKDSELTDESRSIALSRHDLPVP